MHHFCGTLLGLDIHVLGGWNFRDSISSYVGVWYSCLGFLLICLGLHFGFLFCCYFLFFICFLFWGWYLFWFCIFIWSWKWSQLGLAFLGGFWLCSFLFMCLLFPNGVPCVIEWFIGIQFLSFFSLWIFIGLFLLVLVWWCWPGWIIQVLLWY